MRKICAVTTSRADYGLLHGLLRRIEDSEDLELQLLVSDAHFSRTQGLTAWEVAEDRLPIARSIETKLVSESARSSSHALGRGIAAFADAFADLEPDLVVLLGDRFELLAPSAAALVAAVPIAHIHGGEKTVGAIDDSVRHAITKLAFWHFVATEEFKKRVIQLGEAPDRIFLVGGLGVDLIKETPLMDLETLEESLDMALRTKKLLITYHPTTLALQAQINEVDELLQALDEFTDVHLIFTSPNLDVGGEAIQRRIQDFCERRSDRAKYFNHLGRVRYLSLMKKVDGVVGNSSSGLLEAPTFGVGTVNIGDRQQGRPRATSVIDCAVDKTAIVIALEKLFSRGFRVQLPTTVNPYGLGGATDRIFAVLCDYELPSVPRKSFWDLI